MAKLDKVRWVLAWMMFLFGVSTTLAFGTLKWGLITGFLFSLPLLLQFPRSNVLRAAGIWWGIFLVVQSLISPWISNNYFLTLPPNYKRVFDVKAGFPGISGVQSVTANDLGFRVTKTVDFGDSEPLRIFAIGASSTEQIYLDDHRTWTHLLQSLLDGKHGVNVEVVNTGLSGTRARHHLATLKKITLLKPDIVLFLPGINDWNRQIRKENSGFWQRIVTDVFGPFRLRETVLGRAIQTARFRFSTATFGNNQIGPGIEEETGQQLINLRGSLERKLVRVYQPMAVDRSYASYLKKISTFCKKNALECVFVSQLTGYSRHASKEFTSGFWMTPPRQKYTLTLESMEAIANMYNDYLREFASEEGFYFCDLANSIEPSYEALYDDCHFNENGARLAASLLSLCLSDLVDNIRESGSINEQPKRQK